MKLSFYTLALPITHTFTIARESISTQASLIVELEHEGCRGYGEVTENEFYGHTFPSMIQSLERAEELLDDYRSQRPEQLWPRLMESLNGDTFAAAAFDMAAHDLRGKLLGIPTWQDWGLQWQNVPQSSYTIGIDSPEKMIDKLREMPGWEIYKIKLGTANDLKIMRLLREETDARFRVDANCGWTVEQAIANSHELAELGVEFIEQPLPITAPLADKQRLYRESALPILADEDCQVAADVTRCAGAYHGINVKICKCGGLSPALQMLGQARQLGLKTMVGCMVESSIGISGAAQLLPLLDYADLDGAVLLKDEPARGVRVDHGVVLRSELHGCGGELDRQRLASFLVPVAPAC